MADDWIDELIQGQRPGYSLDQALYVDPAVFRRDRERIFANQWIMAGHVSQIPEPGDYLLFDLAGESLILIRDRQGVIHAHFNGAPAAPLMGGFRDYDGGAQRHRGHLARARSGA